MMIIIIIIIKSERNDNIIV